MSEQWQCSVCYLWNSHKRSACQACFTITKSPQHKFRLTVCLSSKIKPGAQKLKELLVSGYSNRCIKSLVPIDIITLCQRYYDEILHWDIDAMDLVQHSNSLQLCEDSKAIDDKYYSDIFYIEGIKIKCSFDLNSKLYGKPGFNSFTFHVFLPKSIEQMILYIESYCAQNRAEFKNRATFNNRSYDDWSWMMTDVEVPQRKDTWSESTHYMKLNWKDFDSLHFSYHIDILSIKYADRENYLKPIRMKTRNHFKWYIDGEFLDECRSAIGSQLFFSDTFDDENHNWCLRIQPMGSAIEMDMQNRMVILVLKFLKKPSIDDSLSVVFRVTVRNSCNVIDIEHMYHFNGYNTSCQLGQLFPSKKLFEISSFTIDVDIEVFSVDENTDFEQKYRHIFY